MKYLFVLFFVLSMIVVMPGCMSEVALPAEVVEMRLNDIVLSPDQAHAVVVGGGFIAMLQEPRPGYGFLLRLKPLSIEQMLPEQKDGLSGAVILQDKESGETKIVTGSYDGSLCLSRPGNVELVQRIELNAGAITALAPAVDGKSFFAATWRGKVESEATSIFLYDPQGNISRRYAFGEDGVGCLSVSPDGRLLAACGVVEGNVMLLDVESGRFRVLRSSGPGFDDRAKGICFVDPHTLVVAGELRGSGWIEVWNVANDKIEQSVNLALPVHYLTASGKLVAVIEKGGALRFRSLSDLQPLSNCKETLNNVSIVAIFSGGVKMIYVTNDGVAGITDINK